LEKLRLKSQSSPEEGYLAEGSSGRLAALSVLLKLPLPSLPMQDLAGETVLVSRPHLREIDPVRYITNRSSGKWGMEPETLNCEGRRHSVGRPNASAAPEMSNGSQFEAEQMHEAVRESFREPPFLSAAVSDFRPKHRGWEDQETGSP
jgi:phosphopantothenoylcysteine synthetase/decarboxylase